MVSFRKVLVRSPNWIGDHVLASSFYQGLREAFPEAEITLGCPESIAELAQAQWFDRCLPLPRAHRKLPSAIRYWRSKVRTENFDLGISLASSMSAAFLFWAARIAERVGYADAGASVFFTRSKPWLGRGAGKHKSEIYLELLDVLKAPRPALREIARATTPLAPTILLAPGASIALREWPYFAELARQLRRLYPSTKLRIVGSMEQQRWGAVFQALQDPGIENWIGLTSLSELLVLCRQAQVVVANDSGIAHLSASLAGAPTVVLFGPGDPDYVRPQGTIAVARASHVPCSPCESARCHARYGYQKCLRELSVDEVLSRITTLVSATAHS